MPQLDIGGDASFALCVMSICGLLAVASNNCNSNRYVDCRKICGPGMVKSYASDTGVCECDSKNRAEIDPGGND